MLEKIPKTWKKIGMILLGCLIYAVGMNTFITPLNLCSGGGVGVAQLITYFLGNPNLYGIMYLLINIPLFVLAWKGIDKNFFVKTAIGVGAISFFATIIPVPEVPIVSDTTISILSGSLITGAGTKRIPRTTAWKLRIVSAKFSAYLPIVKRKLDAFRFLCCFMPLPAHHDAVP